MEYIKERAEKIVGPIEIKQENEFFFIASAGNCRAVGNTGHAAIEALVYFWCEEYLRGRPKEWDGQDFTVRRKV